ncbi:PREDICTED: kinesin-like protein KIF9 [Polistes dominula]|uniref:Kinesin-like protein KIF9 n=1 Tax=Polistes dominula TaxID=743375 RepID=A0ABM1JHA3_POLDO|nr:PREDICTED: kinesin-like protein KIF9 [Polistes dominula]
MTDDELESNEKNIKVFVRILPLEKQCKSCAQIDTEHKKICIRCLQDLHTRRSANKNHIYWCFQTDGIFYNASQEEVYKATTTNLIEKVLDGVNCIIYSYGQIGSGKSFTIGGLRNNWEHRGLVMRLLSDMFTEKAKRRKVNKIQYRLSFVELRGKEVKDLLLAKTENKIKVNDTDAFKNVTIINVNNQETALKKLFEGETRRSIVTGSFYPASHLGTAVITLHVSNTSLITSWAVVAKAKIHIVEMAGTGTVGKRNCMKSPADVGAANLGQTQVETFFLYLRGFEISTKCILRSNNLFKFLGQALSVTSMLRFIAHVCITKEDLDSTLTTLRFASTVSKLRPVKMKYNVRPHTETIISELKKEIEMLKRELELNEMFSNQESTINISKLRYEQMHRDVMHFLNGTLSDMTLYSVSQMEILLTIIKNLYQKLTLKQAEVDTLIETYENALKNINEITFSINLSEANNKTILSLKNNSIENETLNVRSTISQTSKDIIKNSKTEQVGVLKKTGITLGNFNKEAFEKMIKIYKHEQNSLNFDATEVHKQFKDNNKLSVCTDEGEKAVEDLKVKFYQLQNMMIRSIETKHQPKISTISRKMFCK